MARIGVFVCHCGENIGRTVRADQVAKFAKNLPGTVFSADYPYFCSAPGQKILTEAIREHDAPMFANPEIRLEWDPADAGVFAGGDHGFTSGRYELTSREGDAESVVLSRGSYLTIWRLDDGVWKVILDTGSPDS